MSFYTSPPPEKELPWADHNYCKQANSRRYLKQHFVFIINASALTKITGMDFIFVWIIVQLANLVVWVLAARLALVRYHIDRHIYIPQCESSKYETTLCRTYKKFVSSLLEEDNTNVGGFAPPRALRTLLVAIFAIQNILGLVTIDQASPLQELLRRSGQMACVNLVPLVILGFPAAGLEVLVRQTSPQTAWAHHAYGWIVWYEALLHFLTHALLSPSIGESCRQTELSRVHS